MCSSKQLPSTVLDTCTHKPGFNSDEAKRLECAGKSSIETCPVGCTWNVPLIKYNCGCSGEKSFIEKTTEWVETQYRE